MEPRKTPAGRRRSGSAVEFAAILSVCLVLVFGGVRPFVAEVFLLPSASMSPTLLPGERVLVEKVTLRLGAPERGDLVAFERGGGVEIKRVAGLPGDRVEVRDGVLFVDGERLREPYVDYRLTDGSFFGPVRVSEGSVFVLGDNRSNSLDSRELGPVAEGDLLGRVVGRGF
ncbi:signal peptidase I [Rubrobacter radiotolerans]|uniref:Signal peptidase I n=1 Tax=Rubrobacter radiotolerans TaxID=42256 RepID=A0A023X2A9_RUBRA|nr:signal peptidase I [Rubrobacter radiotolerans]AHY46488.1 signal peptidase I [Rubrobacter radiotolerans]SMC04716.1 signal peptidase I [Rubrobacter radiotolerans DSM 5868]